MVVVNGSWSECSDDSYEIVNYDEVAEVIGYDDDDHHKDFLNNGEGIIVDSSVKLDNELEHSKSMVNVKKSFPAGNVIKTVDDSRVSKQAHDDEEEETKIDEVLLMEATRCCSHSRPDHQVISPLNKAEQKKKTKAKLKKKEKKRGAASACGSSSSNDIISSCINGIDHLLADENITNMEFAATVIFGLFFFSNLRMLVYLCSLLLLLATTT